MDDTRIFPDDGDRLMSIDEAAARLRTSPTVVRQLLESKVIIPIRYGKRRYIRKYTLNGFLQQVEGKDIMDFVAE